MKLSPQQQARLASSRPVDPEAYEAYLMGRYYFSKALEGNWPKAKEYFEKAIAKDSSFALAYASLAELHSRAQYPATNPRYIRA